MNMVVSLAFLSGVQVLAAVSLVAAACAVLAWWIQQQEFRRWQDGQRVQAAEAAAVQAVREAEAVEKESLLHAQLAEVRREHEAAEGRLVLHLNAMTRREGELRLRCEELEAKTKAGQEADARLDLEAKRAAELEVRLTEEAAKVKALEQSLSLITTRAQEMARQLQESRELISKTQEQRMSQQTEMTASAASWEEMAKGLQLRAESLEVERVQLRAAHSSLQQMAEARLAEVQGQLDAALAELAEADVRAQMQVLAQQAPSSPQEEAQTQALQAGGVPEAEAAEDLRVAVSEGMQTQQRLNARIAELEYRLAEAEDRNAGALALMDQVSHTEALRTEVARLTAENEALADDLETAKMARSGLLAPVPEVG